MAARIAEITRGDLCKLGFLRKPNPSVLARELGVLTMALFNVTHQPSGRTLHIRAACRTCARRIAVEHIALTGPTAEWRDPEQTRVDFVGSGNGPSGVLTDSQEITE